MKELLSVEDAIQLRIAYAYLSLSLKKLETLVFEKTAGREVADLYQQLKVIMIRLRNTIARREKWAGNIKK